MNGQKPSLCPQGFTLQQKKRAKPGRQAFPWGWGHMPQARVNGRPGEGLGMLVLDSMARIREKLVILFCLCEHEYLGLKRGQRKGGVLLPRKQLQFLAAPSQFGADYVCCWHCSVPAAWHHLLLQAHSFLWHQTLSCHSCAHIPPPLGSTQDRNPIASRKHPDTTSSSSSTRERCLGFSRSRTRADIPQGCDPAWRGL